MRSHERVVSPFQGHRAATSPTTRSRPRSTARSRSSGRCWSRASPAPARRCSPRPSPRRSACALITWHVKSTTRAQDGLYVYDTVQRLYDSRFGDGDVKDIRRYIKLGPLGQRVRRRRSAWCCSSTRSTRRTSSSRTICSTSSTGCASSSPRPATRSSPASARSSIITSNNEKELPDAFLRRCVFHFIDFPEQELMRASSAVHHPTLDEQLVDQAVEDVLRAARAARGSASARRRASSSTGSRCSRRAGIKSVKLDEKLPFLGALLKKEQDLVALRRPARRAARQLAGREARHVRRVPLRAARSARCRWARRRRVALAEALSAGPARQLAGRLLPRGARALRAHRGAPRRLRPGLPRALQGRRARRHGDQRAAARVAAGRRRSCRELTRRGAGAARAVRPRRSCRSCSRSGCASRRSATTAATSGSAPAAPRPSATRRAATPGHPRGRRGRQSARRIRVAGERACTRATATTWCSTCGRSRWRCASCAPSPARAPTDELDIEGPSTRPRKNAGELEMVTAPAAPAQHARDPDDGRGRLDGPVRAS